MGFLKWSANAKRIEHLDALIGEYQSAAEQKNKQIDRLLEERYYWKECSKAYENRCDVLEASLNASKSARSLLCADLSGMAKRLNERLEREERNNGLQGKDSQKAEENPVRRLNSTTAFISETS